MYMFLLPSRKSVQALPPVIVGQITDFTVATSLFILIKKQTNKQTNKQTKTSCSISEPVGAE